ncbi:MAG: hypothetical protein RMJ43_06535 [Chloroherpetonaceae bacterium]|nr:hypothetical protein [Chthonomonadaceae bacterium]MDW8207476.1 hypothetical protein [Chloroherpetonaceae bacterium]
MSTHLRMTRWMRTGVAVLLATVLLFEGLSALAQRRGSFGGSSFGGGRSFGGSFGRSGGSFGGSFGSGRSFGGGSSFGGGMFGGSRSSGSFGSGRSFGGSFGGSRSSGSFGGSFGSRRSNDAGSSFGGSFGSGRSFGGSFGSGAPMPGRSFGSSGSFGRSGSFGSVRTATRPPAYYGQRPISSRTYYINGTPYIGHSFSFWSGFSLGWALGSPPWYFYTPFSPYFYFHRPVLYNGELYPGGFNWLNFFIGLLFFAFLIWVIWMVFRNLSGGGRRKIRYTTYN